MMKKKIGSEKRSKRKESLKVLTLGVKIILLTVKSMGLEICGKDSLWKNKPLKICSEDTRKVVRNSPKYYISFQREKKL